MIIIDPKLLPGGKFQATSQGRKPKQSLNLADVRRIDWSLGKSRQREFVKAEE